MSTPPTTSRRQFVTGVASGLSLFGLAPMLQAAEPSPVETLSIAEGDLRVLLRDNAKSPGILSGVDSLFHQKDAPGFDAYDPDGKGSSAGLNFEHIIAGHQNAHNRFSPRLGTYPLFPLPGGKSARLVRKKEDDPWAVSSTFQYTVAAPHYIDMDFRCVPHNRALFGPRGYAILFFANYMNDVEDIALHFRGVDGPGQEEKWIRADAPKGHRHWKEGGTYRSLPAADLAYDEDQTFTLNSWSYDYPRFTRPFYYGRAGKGMVLQLMFDRMHTAEDEVRFSLFKFKVPRAPRPAWDFQYVIRGVQQGKEYGFRARLVWKKFVSPEDCVQEYERWAAK